MNEANRILVINDQSLEKENATGITLKSILLAWDSEAIMELYIDPKDQNNAKEAAYRSQCIIECYPVQKLMRSNQTININAGNHQDKTTTNAKIKQRLRRALINFCDCSPFILKPEFKNDIDNFKPEVVYTLAGSVAVMRAAVAIAKKYRIPIVIHFMDDWAHYLQNNSGIDQKIYRRILKYWLKRSYEYTRVNFAISPQMAEEYEKETGIRHIPLMNSVNIEELWCEEKIISNPVILTYAGGLHLQRWKALLEISETLPILSEQTGRKFELHIYTNLSGIEEIRNIFANRYVEFFDYVPHGKVKTVFEKSDILIHAESAASELLGFFRFSISTKIPEYLSTNRCFVFYGPNNIGLHSYLRDNKVAFVSNSREEFIKVINEIIDDTDNAKEMRKKAYMFVKNNHEISSCRAVFQVTISSCIELERGVRNG